MDNKQAIEELKQIKQNHIDLNYKFRHLYDDYMIAVDKAIASLENEKPKGHWIKIGAYQGKCSCCNNCVIDEDENFGDYCRHCGADMRGDE